ncbi:small EDRK-rich factor 1-like [Saccopteryx leptura]|uniref:small EDRK-rich factor 1-like n=1 Tax=Saccopteryx leptura TaxID=249018 RepID=UPI00339CC749
MASGGRMWPAGRSLGTPDIDLKDNMLSEISQRKRIDWWLPEAGYVCGWTKWVKGVKRESKQKNTKKAQEMNKGKRKEDSLTISQRKRRDSEIMQQKQKAANEKKSIQRGRK